MSDIKEILNKENTAFGPEELNLAEKAFLDLYRSAGFDNKKAALFALKSNKKSKKLISKVSGMMKGSEQDEKSVSTPLLAFTFFYSVAIYILLLSFYFWQWRTDIKPEK